MTALEILYPKHDGPATLEAILARTGATRRPFAPEVVDFLDRLSRDLFPLVRTDPSLAPLAFFVRRANLLSLAESAARRAPEGAVSVPQGTVFHVPPTNVDTLFLYTLAITMLAGNSNVVRISRNAGPATYRIVELLIHRLEQHPEVQDLVTVISFDRDPAILAALSRSCNLRMVWGGDAAIAAIRTAPLAPHAKELTFPDRVSLAAISVSAWADGTEGERRATIEGLYNDTYWFDQMACSSPVQLILVGGSGQDAARVRREISTQLATVANSRYAEVEGQAINKMVDVLRGLDRGLRDVEWTSNSVVTVAGARVADATAIRPGGGFFSIQHLARIADLAAQVDRRIQTLSVFGFAEDELREFVAASNGLGVDRIVPIGHALDFAAVWDGKDLLVEALRFVTISVD